MEGCRSIDAARPLVQRAEIEEPQLTGMQLGTRKFEDLQSSICCELQSRKDGFEMFEGCTILRLAGRMVVVLLRKSSLSGLARSPRSVADSVCSQTETENTQPVFHLHQSPGSRTTEICFWTFVNQFGSFRSTATGSCYQDTQQVEKKS